MSAPGGVPAGVGQALMDALAQCELGLLPWV